MSGTYRPGNGRVEGRIRGTVLRGRWEQAGGSGQFEFALSPDGQSFVGRFGSGEYWNGTRLAQSEVFDAGHGNQTPRALISSVLAAIGAARDGDAAAELALRRHIGNLDGNEDVRITNQRVTDLARLMWLSAFRIGDVPDDGPDGVVTIEIGPTGVDWTFPVRVERDVLGLWRLHLPETGELATYTAGLLDAADAENLDVFERRRSVSPRATLRDFVIGTQTWHEGGEQRALDALDMSQIPVSLRHIDGPIAAEYLRQIIERIGLPLWQEIPNDPDSTVPYLLYQNVAGRVVIDRIEADDDSVAWKFTAQSLQAAPGVHDVLQNLPPLPGLVAPEPITRAFLLRQELRAISPAFLRRSFLLENWQWAAILLAVPLAFGISYLFATVLRRLAASVLRPCGADEQTIRSVQGAFGWPVHLNLWALFVYALVQELGLRQDASGIAYGGAAILMAIGTTAFVYCLVDAIARSLARSAEKTATSIDDIATAVGGGIARIGVILGGIIFGSELLNLPYEGVIAALGVGGLAIGFAARDAVSNVISAGILLADRPFRKGDLVEVNGELGVIEDVGLRSTRLRTLDDVQVVIPNAKISEEQVSNWGKRRSWRVQLRILCEVSVTRPIADEFVARLRSVFAAQPEALPGALIALDDLGAEGVAIEVDGMFAVASKPAFKDAKHRFVADVLDLAHELEIPLCMGREMERDMPRDGRRSGFMRTAEAT